MKKNNRSSKYSLFKQVSFKQLSFFLIVIFMLLFSFQIVSSTNNQVLNFKICGNDDLGQLILGYDYYVLCEGDFSDYVYEKLTNTTYDPLYVEEIPEPNMYPETLFEVFSLAEQGYSPKDIFLTYLDDDSINKLNELDIYRGVTAEVTFNQFNILNKKLKQEMVSNVVDFEDLDNLNSSQIKDLVNEINKINYSEINESILEENNSFSDNLFNDSVGNLFNDSSKKDTPSNNEDNNKGGLFNYENIINAKKSLNLINYLEYIAIGLIILLGIYFLIHSLEKKKHQSKELKLLKSYVDIFRKQSHSDEEIKNYILKKGYSEKIASKALKK